MPVDTTHSSVSVHTGLHIHVHVHITYMYTCTVWAHTGIFKLGLSDSSQPCLMHYLCMQSCCGSSGTYHSLRIMLASTTTQSLRVAGGSSLTNKKQCL